MMPVNMKHNQDSFFTNYDFIFGGSVFYFLPFMLS
jgi:hypothetical protein